MMSINVYATDPKTFLCINKDTFCNQRVIVSSQPHRDSLSFSMVTDA